MDGERVDSESLDIRVRALSDSGDTRAAVTLALRALGPEILGFLSGVLHSDADADEAFAATSERLWRSLSTFAWKCSLRTWAYVIARREAYRFRRGARRHVEGRVRISELEDIIAVVRTETRSVERTANRSLVSRLRDELALEDRELLVLRVDRGLSWDEVALTFAEDPEASSEEERKREVSRLRKRFQNLKKRLAERAREEGLLPKKQGPPKPPQ